MNNIYLQYTMTVLKSILILSGVTCIGIGMFGIFFGQAFVDFDKEFSRKYKIPPTEPESRCFNFINKFILRYGSLGAFVLFVLGIFLIYNFISVMSGS